MSGYAGCFPGGKRVRERESGVMVRRARWNRCAIDSACNKSNNLPNVGGLCKRARTCRYGYALTARRTRNWRKRYPEAPFNPRAIPTQLYRHPVLSRSPLGAFCSRETFIAHIIA